jgi:hypothetical protein
MELTEEMRGHIRHWAGLMLEPRQIANIMDVPIAEFELEANKKGTEINLLIAQGRDIQIAKVREVTFKAAAHGSSPALAQANKFILEMKLKAPRQ